MLVSADRARLIILYQMSEEAAATCSRVVTAVCTSLCAFCFPKIVQEPE